MVTSAVRLVALTAMFWVGALLVFLSMLHPPLAQAWTRAHVREARVQIDRTEPARVAVRLELTVDVRGGWLERLEIAGLENDLVLPTEQAASVLLETGEEVPAQASAQQGVITLRFARESKVRRGVQRIRVRYANQGVNPPEGARARSWTWTLPGWEDGLQLAEVTLVGPRGMRARDLGELAQTISVHDQGAHTTLVFKRVHVPRATPWPVTVLLPAGGAGARAEEVQAAPTPLRQPLHGVWLAAFSLAAALAARARVRDHLRELGMSTRGLLGKRKYATFWLAAGAMVCAAVWAYSLPCALVGLLAVQVAAIERPRARRTPWALGAFEPIDARARRRLSRAFWRTRIGVPWADVSSWFGALGLLALLGVVFARADAWDPARAAWGLGGMIGALAWFASAQACLPRSLAEQVRLLLEAAQAARVAGVGLRLVWYVAGTQRTQPRLNVVPAARYAGLLGLDVLVDTRRGAEPWVLRVLAVEGSAVERWTCMLWPVPWREQLTDGARVALLIPVQDVSASLDQLLAQFSAQSERALGQDAPRKRAA